VGELGEAPAEEEVAAWRSQPRQPTVGSGSLAGGLHKVKPHQPTGGR
jgi:hypothetical protein